MSVIVLLKVSMHLKYFLYDLDNDLCFGQT